VSFTCVYDMCMECVACAGSVNFFWRTHRDKACQCGTDSLTHTQL